MRQQRQRYHSIPLRRQAHLMQKAGQIQASTSRPVGRPDRLTRDVSARQTMPTEAPTRLTRDVNARQTMPTEAPTRLVPHDRMPLLVDADALLPSQRSAIRYTDSQGRAVIQQGRHRLVIQRAPQQKRRVSRVLFVGIGMLAMLFFWLAFQALATSIQAHTVDAQYGYPRFWQTDQVLHLDNDSLSHQTHLVFQNVNGHVFFLVLPAGDVSKAQIYRVANLYGADAANWPVTATFEDVNHDGKVDVLVTIDDQHITFLNTGTSLKEQTQP